ncbi:MAG: hypothetical protein ACRDGT_09350 [Candidatus Limnocylindria bacterium]
MNNVRALAAAVGLALVIAIGAIAGPSANAGHLPTVGLGAATSIDDLSAPLLVLVVLLAGVAAYMLRSPMRRS